MQLLPADVDGVGVCAAGRFEVATEAHADTARIELSTTTAATRPDLRGI